MTGNNYMKKGIVRMLARWGLVSEERYEKKISSLETSLEITLDRSIETWNTVEEYESMIQSAFEANHRLKKLEEYLKVEYVANKKFIGYKKKK